MISGVIHFLIFVLTGLLMGSIESNPKVHGLVFVLLAIGIFPLGSIISGYVLLYVFVIYPNEAPGYLTLLKTNDQYE